MLLPCVFQNVKQQQQQPIRCSCACMCEWMDIMFDRVLCVACYTDSMEILSFGRVYTCLSFSVYSSVCVWVRLCACVYWWTFWGLGKERTHLMSMCACICYVCISVALFVFMFFFSCSAVLNINVEPAIRDSGSHAHFPLSVHCVYALRSNSTNLLHLSGQMFSVGLQI